MINWEERVKSDEVMGGIVIFIFGGITTLLSLRMPIGNFRMAGTGLFPLCLGILLMILSGIFVFRMLLQSKKVQEKRKVTFETPESQVTLLLFLGTIVLVTLLFNRLGFPLSSLLLMLVLMRILGVKNWRLSLPLSFIIAIACYFLFVQWLKIPLPKGWIGI